jgi:uncharacterized protein
VPGYSPNRSGLAVLSRSGADVDADDVDLNWGPDEVLACWKAG